MATEVVPNIDDEAYEPQTYDEAFPALHSNRNDSSTSVSHGDIKLAVRSTKTTQVNFLVLYVRGAFNNFPVSFFFFFFFFTGI